MIDGVAERLSFHLFPVRRCSRSSCAPRRRRAFASSEREWHQHHVTALQRHCLRLWLSTEWWDKVIVDIFFRVGPEGKAGLCQM